jgi:Skp family chaperone for outer membrane proteins
MDFIKRNLLLPLILLLAPLSLFAVDLNIATINSFQVTTGTDVAKQQLEELTSTKEWKEADEERQAKINEFREIQEKLGKDGTTMSDEEKQEAGKRLQSLEIDVTFFSKKLQEMQQIAVQSVQQQQAEKYNTIVTELIRAKAVTLLLEGDRQRSNFLYADPSLDITQEVIDAMNQVE